MTIPNVFRGMRFASIALLVAASGLSMPVLAQGQNQAIDVEAGPIFSNEQAQTVCPELAAKLGGAWTGNWVTTVWGEMSVCNVDFGDSESYRPLTTMFQEGENKCFEGNRLAPGSTLQGAAFMDNCQNVTGQFWKIIPAGGEYFRLTTMFLEGENKCLEGNRFAPESTLQGAAFMDDCQNVTGQLWKMIPADNGYFRLTTQFLEAEGKCLEGNRFAPESTLGGGAFMDNCQNVTGQLWRFK